MNKSSSLWPNVLCVLATIIFGFPAIHAALNHPVSRMASANPLYKGLTQNAFMVMSSQVEPVAGRLVRYTDKMGRLQISRIAGMAGDHINFTGHTLLVNGKSIGSYPSVTVSDESFSVPQETVFCFPDFIPAYTEKVETNSLKHYLLPVKALNGSILYVFDNATSGKEHPELFAYGTALILLYGAVFFGLGSAKSSLSKPLYVLARLTVGLNLAIWLLLSVYGLATGLTAIVPAIYYIFVSTLNFFGLSIAASSASVLAIVSFAIVAGISDRPINLRRDQVKL